MAMLVEFLMFEADGFEICLLTSLYSSIIEPWFLRFSVVGMYSADSWCMLDFICFVKAETVALLGD